MLAAGGGWRGSSEDALDEGVARADSWSGGGGAVEGDGRGEASDSDDELPDTVSRFLLLGDGVMFGGRLGEATRLLASYDLRLKFTFVFKNSGFLGSTAPNLNRKERCNFS